MNAASLTRDALIGDWTVWATPDGERLGQISLLPDLTYINSLYGPVPARHWGNWSLTDCGEFQFIRFDLEGTEPQQRAEPNDPEPALWPDFLLAMILGGDEQRIDTPGAIWTRVNATLKVPAELKAPQPPLPSPVSMLLRPRPDSESRPHAMSHENL